MASTPSSAECRDQVDITGASRAYTRVSDESEESATFHFCAECGATVYYTNSAHPEMIAIPVGALADPAFPTPTISVWEDRMHRWVTLPADIRHIP